MIGERIDNRGMVADVASLLIAITTHDIQTVPRLSTLNIIPPLATLFLDDPTPILPFAHAWLSMFGAIARLDDLQDGDPLVPPLPAVHRDAQYTLLFGNYLAATSLLDMLDSTAIPVQRINRVRRFWSDMLLRMVSGQYADLTISVDQPTREQIRLYQQIAQAKTGATFTLAFGGTAMLCCDDPAIYEPLAVIGELYGTLLQYGDDLNDQAHDPRTRLTLPTVLPAIVDEPHTPAFWHVYQQYCAAIDEQRALLPEPLRAGVQKLMGDLLRLQDAQ